MAVPPCGCDRSLRYAARRPGARRGSGLLLGVGICVALFLRRSTDPHIAVLGRLAGTPHFRNVDRYPVETRPTLVAARVDESLHFANADQVETRLAALAEGEDIRHLLLVMSAVNFVDASGLAMPVLPHAPVPARQPPHRAPLVADAAGGPSCDGSGLPAPSCSAISRRAVPRTRPRPLETRGVGST